MKKKINWSDFIDLPEIKFESHFGNDRNNCFIERPKTFYSLFFESLKKNPNKEAVIFHNKKLTYTEISSEIDRIARGLNSLGLKAGDRIIILISNKPEFYFALFAIQKIGAIAVPVGIREKLPALKFICNQCKAKAIIHDHELLKNIPNKNDSPSLKIRISTKLETKNSLYIIDGPNFIHPKSNEEDCACILYTSGTTGNPKGAIITHINIAHTVINFKICMKLNESDKGILAVPASHVTGLIALIATITFINGTLVILEEFKANKFLKLIENEAVNYTVMVPAMYKLCLMDPNIEKINLNSWRIGAFGGSPMPIDTIKNLMKKIPNLNLINCYGATETTSPATIMPIGLQKKYNDSVGISLPCAEIQVRNENGKILSKGEIGELWISGSMVIPGYWENSLATKNSFSKGFWKSGDIGTIDELGLVRIFDRAKDMINRGGFKIYSVEVENIIIEIPQVVEVAIIGYHCQVLGERVLAVIYTEDNSFNKNDVKAYCEKKLADYKVPEKIIITFEPLPRNANGKLLKRELRKKFLN